MNRLGGPTGACRAAYNPAMSRSRLRTDGLEWIFFAAVGVVIAQGCGEVEAAPGGSQTKVAEIYSNNCASCHGDALDNGNAPSLLDDQWLTDGSDRALYDAIWDGIEDLGMPAYAGALSEAEAWGLVVHIREKAWDRAESQRQPAEANDRGVFDSQHHRFTVETVAEGLDRPWALAFLPDGTLIFTERSGTLHLVEDGQVSEPIADTPEVWNFGQGGLLDVAVDPNFADNGWIYLSYSEKQAEGGRDGAGMTAVVRGRLDRGRRAWIDQQELFHADAEHASERGQHFGSRFVFEGDDILLFSIGDRGMQDRAQQLDRPNGKVHRIHTDGSIPKDNPFAPGSDGAKQHPEALPTVWSWGHRNPQGLDRHPETGRVYDIEHGPRGGDEINLVEPQHNYGWPEVAYSINYNQLPFGNRAPWHEEAGFTEPVHYWIPSIAICGASFYVGAGFPNWENDLFVSALAKEQVHRVRFGDDGRSVVEEEVLFEGNGRVRDVIAGPDGSLYIATEQPGMIRKLVPAGD